MTLDTNIHSIDDLIAAVSSEGFEFAVASVTDRETGFSVKLAAPSSISRIPETSVWGESRWGDGVWGGPNDASCLERTLVIIGNGSFPPRGRRDNLTHGQRNQLRDAMILCAHVRAQRQIFVSNDERAFIRGNRRNQLQQAFSTRIMTRSEFLSEFSTK